MRVRTVLAVVVTVVGWLATISGQADLPFAKAETVGMSSKRLERINAFIKDYIDTNQIAGAVTLVARKGKIVHFEAQGSRYKEENQPMEKDAIFSLASMTKPIVSTALMMLWEDGKFMLDDPIAKWLPSYANKQVLDPLTGRRTPARPVTVRHILSHTSGLSLTAGRTAPPLTDSPADDADGDPLLEPDPQAGAGRAVPAARPKTLLEAVERAAGSPLAFQPGERWQYGSSTDFVAILVEKMSGMTIDEFVRTKSSSRSACATPSTTYRARKWPKWRRSIVPTRTGRSRCSASPSIASRRPTSRCRRAERHGRRLFPLLADAAERRRVQRPAPARPHDGQRDDHQSDRHRASRSTSAATVTASASVSLC
jgi:hypothetical protein